MVSSTFIILFFGIFSQIGITFGDVHTAFDVIGGDPERGGCQPAERNKAEDAFSEAIEMVGLIRNAITALQAGTEPPAVGWIFDFLFGIMATEELNDRGIGRPQEQTAALGIMDNLFAQVERHSTAQLQLPNSRGVVQKSRLYCNQKWLRATDRLIDRASKAPSVPVYFLPANDFPGVTHWYDIHADIYLPPAKKLVEPDKLVCGAVNGAHTSTDTNVITFCPRQFDNILITVASMAPPAIDAQPPRLLDEFNTMSMTFLHEYTHLLGRSSLANAVPDVDLFPEHYQFAAAIGLLKTSGMDNALKNADSYALLGVALKLSQCDWRDGACRSPSYWEAVRQQRLEAARLLISIL